ncbi:hypothetical protein Nepgr_031908 [Nepenthes gracilis]|uniref:Uncharacterized protein n=1 Tax=Nepenthes gracilis TaxID=150966 RepID=A0AAD3THL3_NEPGR|nr:hypothetical protein Nepgr_031908 [Nepenthes gracilis]
MDGRKKSGSSSSSSSFTNDLVGSKDSSSSPAGVFESIFAPPSKVVGRESASTDTTEKQDSPNDDSNTETDSAWFPENLSRRKEGETHRMAQRSIDSILPEERVRPCHFSSSIYYGGQDVYANPPSTQSTSSSTFKKDGDDHDDDSASRGNWWQGSLYY